MVVVGLEVEKEEVAILRVQQEEVVVAVVTAEEVEAPNK